VVRVHADKTGDRTVYETAAEVTDDDDDDNDEDDDDALAPFSATNSDLKSSRYN
jgi:hypothetical protein